MGLDPLSKYDIYYGKEQFPRLREMADAILVEETLANLRKGTAQDGAFCCGPEHEGRPRMPMAPDNKGRTLAAIFTSDDA